MSLKQWMMVAVVVGSGVMATAQQISPATADAVKGVIGDVLVSGKAYEYDEHLADEIGPRLTGSASFMKSAAWAESEFKALGLTNVHTEGWTIPATWEPESASGRILSPVEKPLHLYSVGWSPSARVSGSVFVLTSMEPSALDAARDKIQGAVVVVPREAYAPLLGSLSKLVTALEKLEGMGAKALLTQGIENGAQSSTAMSVTGKISPVPLAQVGKEDFLLLERLAAKGPVTVEFSMQNKIRKDVSVPEVVAEIRGSELPDEVVIVGGHLDSWDPGTGAQDNGTGVAMVMDTARAVMATHRAPKRTMRFILFSGEEQGLLGSNAYVKKHLEEMGKIDAVLITDSGAEPAQGWYVMGREDERKAMTAISPLLAGLGADGLSSDTSEVFGTDHAAFDVNGVPVLVLWTGEDKYSKLHHKASDTFDSVVQKDLAGDTAVVAATAFAIADENGPFAKHLSDAERTQMLKSINQDETYQYMKSHGIMP